MSCLRFTFSSKLSAKRLTFLYVPRVDVWMMGWLTKFMYLYE